VKSRYFVYVLRNPAGLHYIGLSEDPLRRLEQHNSGNSRWTRNRGPWVIIWTRGGMTLAEARKLENELKKQKGGDGFYQLTGLERVKHALSCAESPS